MYTKFFGLNARPFTTLPDPDFLYFSKKHEMALTYLEYGLTSQAGFMVLTGDVGAGKTTLLNYLIRKLDLPDTHVAIIFNTNLDPDDLLQTILQEWGVEATETTKTARYDRLNEFLIAAYRKQESVLLIIDEAQNLPFPTLEEIRMISNLNDAKAPLLHIILSGQPNLRTRLNNPRLEQLRQRVTVHYHLEALDSDETGQYIAARLARAGASREIFNSAAITAIYEHTQGLPRLINVVCDLCLVYAFAGQQRLIGEELVASVVRDRVGMGLELAPGTADTEPHGPTIDLERRLHSLRDNVYELALVVKKVAAARNQHAQDLRVFDERLQQLEKRIAAQEHE